MFELLTGTVIGGLAMALWCAYRFADTVGDVRQALMRMLPFRGGGPGEEKRPSRGGGQGEE